MPITPLTAQLPSLAGALPDLFRRNDSTPVRGDDSSAAHTSEERPFATHDEPRGLAAQRSDDMTRMMARHAALGPLTYGRHRFSADVPPPAPVGMRGAHLDVRG